MAERSTGLCIGVVDSGWPLALHGRVRAARSFLADGGGGTSWSPAPDEGLDRLGHGSRVMQAMAALAPEAGFCVAQVFGTHLHTRATQVAQAIDWLAGQGVAAINLSLGVRQDHPDLRAACGRALARGTVLCAATPARGEPVYPAACEGVIRVMGDARCAPGEHSALLLPHADFGACVLPPNGERAHAGASMGCAHLTGRIAALLAGGVPRHGVWEALVTQATFRGPERRRS